MVSTSWQVKSSDTEKKQERKESISRDKQKIETFMILSLLKQLCLGFIRRDKKSQNKRDGLRNSEASIIQMRKRQIAESTDQ